MDRKIEKVLMMQVWTGWKKCEEVKKVIIRKGDKKAK